MIYINGSFLPPGSRRFELVVAHELQHALHWHVDPNEESWINEGLSMLAEELNGFGGRSARLFQASPRVQLTDWEDEPSKNGLHYAAAHLFIRFLGQHWGGYEKLSELVAEPEDGVAGVDAYLAKQGYQERFRDVFKAWVVANAGGNSPDPRHHYQELQVKAQASRRVTESGSFSETAPSTPLATLKCGPKAALLRSPSPALPS